MNLWKYLLILNRNKETGFTIPLVLGFGLFMVLIAITSIKMGSSSETSSKLQKTSSQALGAAEVGVARLQSHIDNARIVAVFPDCIGTRSSAGVCPDTGSTASWANKAGILSVTQTTICGNSTTTTSLDSLEGSGRTGEWEDITAGNPSDGQYRLVSYTYTPNATAQKPPGVGTLIVEGRTGQEIANATKTSTKAYNTGIARIKVEIPVNKRVTDTTSSLPGLRLNYNNSTNMSNDKVNGDILIDGCLVPGGIDTDNLSNPATQKVAFSGDSMPSLPAPPAGQYLIGDGIASADNTPANDPAIDVTTLYDTTTNFPRTGDDAASDGIYYYLIPEFVTNGNMTITLTAGAKVVFLLQGNLNLGGSTTINMQSGGSAVNLQIFGNTTVTTGTGLNGSNYKYGCPSSGVTCPTTQMYFNGTPNVKALIQAPSATGGVAGGGDPGSASFQGTLWINDWNPQSGNSKVKIDAVGTLGDLLSTSTTTKTDPQITVTSSWAREEVP